MEPNKEGTAMFAEARLFDQWFAAIDSAADHTFGFTAKRSPAGRSRSLLVGTDR